MAILLQASSRRLPGRHTRLQSALQRLRDFLRCAIVILAACVICGVEADAQQSSDGKGPENSRIEIAASAWLQQPRGVIHGGNGNLKIDLDKALAEAALRGWIVADIKRIGKLSIPRPDQRRQIDKRESTL